MHAEPSRRFVVRLRFAGALVVAGLVVQGATLLEAHPFTFLAFIVAGAGLVMAGAAAFAWAWFTR